MNYLIDKNTGMFILKEFKALGGQAEVSNVSKTVGSKLSTSTPNVAPTSATTGTDTTTPTTDPSSTDSEEDTSDRDTEKEPLSQDRLNNAVQKFLNKLFVLKINMLKNKIYYVDNNKSIYVVDMGPILISNHSYEQAEGMFERIIDSTYDYKGIEMPQGLIPFSSVYNANKINIFKNKIIELYKKRNPIKESKIIKEYREEINTLLIPTMQKQLKFDKLPTLNFIEDEENAKDMFGRTAHYNPNTSEITVYITGRHPKDIMRSVAHEVVHHAQNCRGEFDNTFNLGEEGYAQSNIHLRKMEKQAYLLGNMLFRDWEDSLKKQRNSTAMINENALRAMIRKLIMKEMQDASKAENVAAKPHEKSCGCPECKTNQKERLAMSGITNIAEATKRVVQEDKQQMPLNEWRRLELNSLLLNRFGIVSPEVMKEQQRTYTVKPSREEQEKRTKDPKGYEAGRYEEAESTGKKTKEELPSKREDTKNKKGGIPKTARQKKLAAMTPPEDKITRGDVIAAAKKGGKK